MFVGGLFSFQSTPPFLPWVRHFLVASPSSFVSRFLPDRRDALESRPQTEDPFLSLPFFFFPAERCRSTLCLLTIQVPSVLSSFVHRDRTVSETGKSPTGRPRTFLETRQVRPATSEGEKRNERERERLGRKQSNTIVGVETDSRSTAHRTFSRRSIHFRGPWRAKMCSVFHDFDAWKASSGEMTESVDTQSPSGT